MKGLEGKTAIVTGGSSGIGQAIAIRLGHEGVNVAVNYVGPPEGARGDEGRDRAGHASMHGGGAGCGRPSRARRRRRLATRTMSSGCSRR